MRKLATVILPGSLFLLGAFGLPRSLPGTAAAAPPAAAAKTPPGKKTAAQKGARAFLDVVTPLLLPVATVDSEVSWAAATDVTPEHTGARTGTGKALAALTKSKL